MDLLLGLVQLSFGNKSDGFRLLAPRGPTRWFHPTLRYLKPLHLSSEIFRRLSSEVCQAGKQILKLWFGSEWRTHFSTSDRQWIGDERFAGEPRYAGTVREVSCASRTNSFNRFQQHEHNGTNRST